MRDKSKSKLTQRNMSSMETRSKIFSTALLMFATKGYDKVTVEAITKFAGVSKGSFYTHFPTKDAILVEQFNKIDDHYEKTFKNVPQEMGAAERLRLLVAAMSDYCQRVCGVNVMKIVYMNQISVGQRSVILNDTKRIFFTILHDIVKRGKDEGLFSEEYSEDDLVSLLVSNIRAAIYEWCLHDGTFDLTQYSARNFKIIINSLERARDAQRD